MTVINTRNAETINIGQNGTYDVARYTTANVNTPAAPDYYIAKTKDANGKLINSTNIINLNGVTDVDSFVLAHAYFRISFPANTSVDLSSLTTLSGDSACNTMFSNCTGITSVDLSNLTTISGSFACQNMFNGCTNITSVDLSSLITISGNTGCQYMFAYCTGLTSIDLSSLETVSINNACQYMFSGCTGITSIDLSSLINVSGRSGCQYMFQNCTSLATVYIGGTTAIDFGTRTDQFNNMFSGCSQNIDVYAPAANQTQIEAFSGYPNFGGTGIVTWHWNTATA